MKRILHACIAVLFLFSVIAAPARSHAATPKAEVDTLLAHIPADWPAAPDVSSVCAVLADADSKTILYAKNATVSMYPASTTKLMTALLTLENLSLDDIVTFSARSINSLPSGSSHIGMKAGESLSVKDCLYGLLLPSANEVANALAEQISGSVTAFTDLMNERADELGCVNTHFSNANGLQDPNHMTCAYDLYQVMAACIRNQTFLKIASASAYMRLADDVLDRDIPMGTTNLLIKKDSEYYTPSVVCGKTGWTQEAGRCLVTYAVSGERRLICVVMDAEAPHQYEDTIQLLNFGFNQFSNVRISEADPSVSSRELDSGSPLNIPQTLRSYVSVDASASVTLPLSVTAEELSRRLSGSDDEAPVLSYYWQGYPVGSSSLIMQDPSMASDLYAAESGTLQSRIRTGRLYSVNIWLLIFLIILIAAIVIYIIMLLRYRSRTAGTAKKTAPVEDDIPSGEHHYYHMQ